MNKKIILTHLTLAVAWGILLESIIFIALIINGGFKYAIDLMEPLNVIMEFAFFIMWYMTIFLSIYIIKQWFKSLKKKGGA